MVQLWHGTPIKKNDLTDLNEQYHYFIISSEIFLNEQKMFTKLNCKILLNGYPRNDILLNTNSSKINNDYNLKILFLPTHRYRLINGEPHRVKIFDLFEYGFDVDNLIEFLTKNNCHLSIKLHPMQRFKNDYLCKRMKQSPQIDLIEDNAFSDVNTHLINCDVLISDYSSVIFDFLLIDKPIFLAPFDIHDPYIRDSLRFEYSKIAPGIISYNWNELIKNLSFFIDNGDSQIENRKIMNNRFNYYKDGNSCERLYNCIIN